MSRLITAVVEAYGPVGRRLPGRRAVVQLARGGVATGVGYLAVGSVMLAAEQWRRRHATSPPAIGTAYAWLPAAHQRIPLDGRGPR